MDFTVLELHGMHGVTRGPVGLESLHCNDCNIFGPWTKSCFHYG